MLHGAHRDMRLGGHIAQADRLQAPAADDLENGLGDGPAPGLVIDLLGHVAPLSHP